MKTFEILLLLFIFFLIIYSVPHQIFIKLWTILFNIMLVIKNVGKNASECKETKYCDYNSTAYEQS